MEYNNYDNPFGAGPREYYVPMPTYNLWSNSQYYKANQFLPRNFYTASQDDRNGSQFSFAPEVKPKREILRDMFNRRIITKESLYKEPELFYEPENEPESPIYGPPKTERSSQIRSSQDEWTDRYWRRAGISTNRENKCVGSSRMKSKNMDSQFKKKIMESIAQPVKSSKAESMMQKMGWQGGALGKGGNGIVEPIAPNIDYAQTTIGFGHRQEDQAPKKKNKKCSCQTQVKKHLREEFVTNALLYILEFVRNDWENEVIFDVKFSNKERRVLHQCVNGIINECDNEMFPADRRVRVSCERQRRALADVRRHNAYVLYTESHGVMPLRQLCLYKDAPEFVYLVTPEDFKEDPILDPPEDNDNPFLKSIKKNLDPGDEFDEPGDLGKLIRYFLEFIREDSYTEFRFLGPFNHELSVCLNTFLYFVAVAADDDRALTEATVRDVSMTADSGDGEAPTASKLRRLFEAEKIGFELIANCNGSIVIHKRKKDAET